MQGGSYLLAGVGFRAIIEAVCIEEDIKGKDLLHKIDNLSKKRLISEKEAERLHSIRFLGNDSVHEMEVPPISKLMLVLRIVEHLLSNLYLFDVQVKNELDSIINNYKDFESLLNKNIMKLAVGQTLTIKKTFGKESRRFLGENLPLFEAELISKIKKGEYDYLSLDSSVTTQSQPIIQVYKVEKKPTFRLKF
jgi:hypothetical protein